MTDDDDCPTARTAPPADRPVSTMPLGTVFEVLAAPRRRFVLYALTDASSVVEFDALVERVADLEREHADADAGEGHRRRIARDLHYWHLPVLADVGIAEYDERSRAVRYHGDEILERWIGRARRDEMG